MFFKKAGDLVLEAMKEKRSARAKDRDQTLHQSHSGRL